ncbi:hypothetical protein MC885_009070 [Smutsia gigantea]|nr:hypothetical protein MC885_009070 [Smutsia gigantea]
MASLFPQTLNVTEQLDAGVWYLDLCIAHMLEGSERNLHFIHLVYTTALVEVRCKRHGTRCAVWGGYGQEGPPPLVNLACLSSFLGKAPVTAKVPIFLGSGGTHCSSAPLSPARTPSLRSLTGWSSTSGGSHPGVQEFRGHDRGPARVPGHLHPEHLWGHAVSPRGEEGPDSHLSLAAWWTGVQSLPSAHWVPPCMTLSVLVLGRLLTGLLRSTQARDTALRCHMQPSHAHEVPTLRQLWVRGQQVLVSYEDEGTVSQHGALWPRIPYWWGDQFAPFSVWNPPYIGNMAYFTKPVLGCLSCTLLPLWGRARWALTLAQSCAIRQQQL